MFRGAPISFLASPKTECRQFKCRLGPSGVHIFDRSFGLNILLDEFAVAPGCWSPSPRHVSIALTNACDLHCMYCFAPKYSAHARFEVLTGWLTELDDNGTLGVGFGGGEPTLYPRFAELCSFASRNTGLAVTFTTHGHQLDESLVSKLMGNVHFVRLSMDGIGATYERLRGKSFSALRRQMKLIAKLARFGINYVVNSETITDLDGAITIAEEAGASEMLLLPEHSTVSRKGIDDDTLLKLRDWITRYGGSIRLAISEYAAEGMPTCDPLAAENGLRAYAHITADGVMKRTSFDQYGVTISSDGLISALDQLSKQPL